MRFEQPILLRLAPAVIISLVGSSAVLRLAADENKPASTVLKIRPIEAEAAAKVSYQKEIKPLLADNCAVCHDAQSRMSGVDVTSVAALLKKGDKSGPGVVPGKPDDSSIVQYIRGVKTPQMPKGGKPLSEAQLHLIRQWIRAGAKDDSEAAAQTKSAAATGKANPESTTQPTVSTPDAAAKINFVKDIQPIFRASCIGCHGPGKQMARLRLDSKRLALQGGISGKAIVPGNSEDSLLMKRILGHGDEPRMPLNADPLPETQIAAIRVWIDEGAHWPDEAAGATAKLNQHWAYGKPVRRTPPKVKTAKNTARVRNPIDNFVLARLEKGGLKLSPEASKATLIRRLSLDLIGLPPSVQEVDAFVADKSPDAYNKVVERLLASPHYGERWARPWLDLARYADTNGYEKDGRRSIHPYRDWVINAFNQDMPFDRFTVEQLAGDMLPNASLQQKVATGFHRNTMLNEEGGVDQGEQRWLTIVDRTNTTATVWMGSTLQCAQCHNHKYDPFTQKDYYQFLAFFDNADEPMLRVPTPQQAAKSAELQKMIASLQADFQKQTPELETAQGKWEREAVAAAPVWSVLDPVEFSSAGGATLTKLDDKSLLAGGANPDQDTYVIKAHTALKGITAFRLEALADASLGGGGPGRVGHGNFVLSQFKVEAATPTDTKTLEPIALQRAAADFSQEQYAVAGALDDKPDTGWAVMPQFNKNHTALFEVATAAQPALSGDGGTTLTFTLHFKSAHPQHIIGRLRLSATTAGNALDALTLPDTLRAILAVPADQRTAAQKTEVADYYRALAPELKPQRDRLAELRGQLSATEGDSTLVMQERPSQETPATDLRIRGSYLNKGERVFAAVPGVLPALPQGQPVNRLTLARWLVNKENPLTARVRVNQIWEQFFGRGLVETSEDFGLQGAPPTHPELLDWLAVEFMGRGWSTKALQRLIVTSATYRQSSRVNKTLMERDPYNKLLARAPRFRLEAEMLRDVVLTASGQLSRKRGGPSVFPPQPEGVWDSPYNGERWETSQGEDRYRRGIYTFLKRTAPYPTFATFDAPSRELCTVRRARTNTPLQALNILNDPAFFDAARALARRMMAEAGPTPQARVAHGFRLCVARTPTTKESARLVALYQQELAHYRKNSDAARLIVNGTAAPSAQTEAAAANAADAGVAELAAWTVVSNVLLNLDETLSRE